jgi:hypothetical protein
MKKLGIILSLSALVFAGCSNDEPLRVGYKTTMEVQSVYDAKTVVRGEIIKAKFAVKNTGDNPLVLATVKGSCTCTIADWTKDPIAPGETGEINAEVNTKDFQPGPVTRDVTIEANTVPNFTKVSVKANIKK